MKRFLAPRLFAAAALTAIAAGCARIEETPGPGGAGVERGPVFDRDGKTLRHGVWTGTHPDGSRRWQVRYVRGEKVGVYREWHANGRLAVQAVHGWDGKPTDDIKRWDEAGNLLATPPAKEDDHGRTAEKTGR